MDTDTNQILGGLFNLANTFATPFAKSLAADQTSTQDARKVANANLDEIVRNSTLNGSGPNDPNMASRSAPTNLFDFINGKGPGQTGNAASPTNYMPFILIGVGVLAIVYVMRR